MKKIVLLFAIFSVTMTYGQKKKTEGYTLDSIQKLDEIIINANYIFGNKYVAKYRTCSAYSIPAS